MHLLVELYARSNEEATLSRRPPAWRSPSPRSPRSRAPPAATGGEHPSLAAAQPLLEQVELAGQPALGSLSPNLA